MSVRAFMRQMCAASLAPAATALMLAAAGLGPVAAQPAPPAAEAPAEEAAPPAAPLPDAGCGAGYCLSVAISPELEGQLAAGPVTLEALAGGLTFDYAGPGPVAVRLIAARYDNGRLVRYGVSERTSLDPAAEALTIPDALDTVTRAFKPATHRGVQIAAVGEGTAASTPVLVQSFVGNVPPTNLVGEAASLIAASPSAAYTGSVGVIALEPDVIELRDGTMAGSVAAVVQLNLVRP